MPGKQPRVLCPVCQEPIPPDETECGNCGAFVIDEAVVRLSRAFGLDRERALKLFDAGFRHPKQLRDRDPNRVLEKGELGILFICTNCGGFVASGDSKCPRCASEFETDVEETPAVEEDILDLVLCPVCGADNDSDVFECEICGEALREAPTAKPVAGATASVVVPAPKIPEAERALEKVDDFLKEPEPSPPLASKPIREPGPVTLPRPQPKVPLPAPAPVSRAPQVVTPPSITPTRRPASALKPIPVPPKAPPGPAPRPIAAPAPRPPPAVPKAVQLVPPKPPVTLQTRVEPLKVSVPAKTAPSAQPAPSIAAAQNPIPRKKVRSAAPPPTGLSAETVGGLVLAAAAGLLLAGLLGQHLVSAGIAAVLVGLAVFQSAPFLRRVGSRPGRLDTALLVGGVLIGLAAALLRDVPAPAATILAIAAALPFAGATRRLLRKPQRVLLAVASAIPIAGQALIAALDPAFRSTIPWMLGIVASMPWPAALAATEILRRQSATVLRRQLARAERNVQQKEYERSLAEYDRAIAVSSADVPGAEIPWYGKGATLILLGRYDEAIRAIDTALDINPRNEVAWVNKGNALTRLGRLIDALRCFNAAIKVNPRFEVAWNNKGNALARLGKFEDALRCYDRALEIDPGYRGAWVNMGFVLTKMGRFDEAASCADHALRLDRGGRADPA